MNTLGNIYPAAFKRTVLQQESEPLPGLAVKYHCKLHPTSPATISLGTSVVVQLRTKHRISSALQNLLVANNHDSLLVSSSHTVGG